MREKEHGHRGVTPRSEQGGRGSAREAQARRPVNKSASSVFERGCQQAAGYMDSEAGEGSEWERQDGAPRGITMLFKARSLEDPQVSGCGKETEAQGVDLEALQDKQAEEMGTSRQRQEGNRQHVLS